MVREPDATMQPTPQDNQLMSKHRVLSLKPHLRLEWRGQDGQNETEQTDHSASLGDSITEITVEVCCSVISRAATVGEYRQLHLRYKPADTRLLLESRRAAWHCGGHLWDRNSHGNYLPRPNGLPEVRSELVLELYGSLRTGWREISSSPARPDHGRCHAAERLGHPARRPEHRAFNRCGPRLGRSRADA